MGVADMGPVDLIPGRWHDLEVVYGKAPEIILSFRVPAGVQLKVRYGYGRFGRNRQQQTTDGESVRRLKVSGWVGRVRMQAKVTRTTELVWKRTTPGP